MNEKSTNLQRYSFFSDSFVCPLSVLPTLQCAFCLSVACGKIAFKNFMYKMILFYV